MRRRSVIQALVLLALVAVSAHLYLAPPSPDGWIDYDFSASTPGHRDARPPPHGHHEYEHESSSWDKPAKLQEQEKEREREKEENRKPTQASEAARALRPNNLKADVRKRDAVVRAFKHAWSAYETDAFGCDEYHPISHRGSNLTTTIGPDGKHTARGIGYTIIDALDTMLLMGAPLADEYARARAWVASMSTTANGGNGSSGKEEEENTAWRGVGGVSTFETTIRTLGGLLSAYHLSGDVLYLRRAAELGGRVGGAFGGMPSPLDTASVTSHGDASATTEGGEESGEHDEMHWTGVGSGAAGHGGVGGGGGEYGGEHGAGIDMDQDTDIDAPADYDDIEDSGIPDAEVWLGAPDFPSSPPPPSSHSPWTPPPYVPGEHNEGAKGGGQVGGSGRHWEAGGQYDGHWVGGDSAPAHVGGAHREAGGPVGGSPAPPPTPPSRGAGVVRRSGSDTDLAPRQVKYKGSKPRPARKPRPQRKHRPTAPPGSFGMRRTDTSIAEAATVQLEFRYLAEAVRGWNVENPTNPITPPFNLTAEDFWYKAERVMQVLNRERLANGLAPSKVDTRDGTFMRSSVRMGSSGDSYYEYLLKQYIQTNRTEGVYLQMYTDAMSGVHAHMVQRSPWKGTTYVTELVPVPGREDWTDLFAPRAKQDHLACFLAGSLMLGATRVHLQDPATAPLIDLEDSPLPVPVPVPVPAGQTAKDAGPVDVDLDVPLANSKAAQKPVVPVVPVVFDDDAVLVPAGQPNERRAAPPFPALANPLTGAQAAQIGKAVQGLRASVPPVLARELTAEGRRDWAVGVALLEGCMQTTKTLTGLAPESVWWRDEEQQPLPDEPGAKYDWFIMGANKFWPPWDARYILRPEISESVFLAYRLTGNPKYRKYAWDIFTAIERFCRLPEGGYASVLDVDHLPVKYEDKQETFFLSETLKYLYLTFADENVLDLNEVVFNTEAHPLPIFTPTIKPRFTEYAPLKPAPTGLY